MALIDRFGALIDLRRLEAAEIFGVVIGTIVCFFCVFRVLVLVGVLVGVCSLISMGLCSLISCVSRVVRSCRMRVGSRTWGVRI